MNKISKTQMMLDSRVLGILTRNLAALTTQDFITRLHIRKIQRALFKRYNAHDVLACQLKIAMSLKLADKK